MKLKLIVGAVALALSSIASGAEPTEAELLALRTYQAATNQAPSYETFMAFKEFIQQGYDFSYQDILLDHLKLRGPVTRALSIPDLTNEVLVSLRLTQRWLHAALDALKKIK